MSLHQTVKTKTLETCTEKQSYQPTSNFVKDGNRDLLAYSHNILKRWKSYYSQLLNVQTVGDVRQLEIHTAESLVPEPNPSEVEIANAKFKKYKSPGRDQILAKLIEAGGEILPITH
jgi:hypothetical protein